MELFLQEMKGLHGQVSGTVNVEMNAAPGIDLSKTLADMRADYEKLAAKYQQEAEDRFQAQVRLENCKTNGDCMVTMFMVTMFYRLMETTLGDATKILAPAGFYCYPT